MKKSSDSFIKRSWMEGQRSQSSTRSEGEQTFILAFMKVILEPYFVSASFSMGRMYESNLLSYYSWPHHMKHWLKDQRNVTNYG